VCLKDGSVSWDGVITTPFGMFVTVLAAQTQALMFPGQYKIEESPETNHQ